MAKRNDEEGSVRPARFTMTLDATAEDQLDFLQDTFGLRSRAAVFDLATSFLHWAALQKQQGFSVGRSNGESFQELLLPQTKPVSNPAPTEPVERVSPVLTRVR